MLKCACLDKYFVSKQRCYEEEKSNSSNTFSVTIMKQCLFNMIACPLYPFKHFSLDTPIIEFKEHFGKDLHAY